MKQILYNNLCRRNLLHLSLVNRLKVQIPYGIINTYCTKVEKRKQENNLPTKLVYSTLHEWYEWWKKNNFFRKTESPNKFVMLLPPPNITGNLHIGHALTVTIQDAIFRWNTMMGKDVIWIPGIDHAGIATQIVVERNLKSQGLDRQSIGREQFIKEAMKWKNENENEIYNQISVLGACVNWEMKYFTMDKNLNTAVSEAFIRLFEKGLIYKTNRIVNWSCALNSVISDIEVEHIEVNEPILLPVPGYKKPIQFGYLHNISYKLTDTDEKVTFGTTRPETVLGDVALMVHPDDKRYTHLHGRKVYHPFRNVEIPILTSTSVLQDVGTGIVKITPGSSEIDFNMAKPYNLPSLEILDEKGCIIGVTGFTGMPRFKARGVVLKTLKQMELYEGYQNHKTSIPICSRSGDVIEKIIKPQWYLKMNHMKERLSRAIKESELKFTPESASNIVEEFLRSRDTDWCISRQLWWGHRIPLYHARVGSTEGIYVAAHTEEDARKKAADKLGVNDSDILISRDEDVLDTWFSSSLLPFSALGWPEETADLKNYFPNSIIETGVDIVYFWVARMAMMSEELMGTLPFKHVICHSLIFDWTGRKMSKSKGNVIDPIKLIFGEKKEENENPKTETTSNEVIAYGVDAVRLSLCSMYLQQMCVSHDMEFQRKCYQFQNKLWQSFRYVNDWAKTIPGGVKHMRMVNYQRLTNVFDKWILSQLARLVCNANSNFKNYNISPTAHQCRNFWQSLLCDKYITISKVRTFNYENSIYDAQEIMTVFWTVCHTYVRLVHPMMPFITEELYQYLPSAERKCDSIMQCDYPTSEMWESFINKEAEQIAKKIIHVTDTIRTLTQCLGISQQISGTIFIEDPNLYEEFCQVKQELIKLSFLEDIEISNNDPGDIGKVMGNLFEEYNQFRICLHLQGRFEPSVQWDITQERLSTLRKERKTILKKGKRVLEDPVQGDKMEKLKERQKSLTKLLKICEEMGAQTT